MAGPSDQALNRLAGWYAIALRLGGALLFTAIAVLAATEQISGWWLGAALTGLCLWSALFTWLVRRSGLTPPVVLADAVVISALLLAQQHLVPAVLIMDDTTWTLPLACTSVYILQLALRPWFGLPAAAIVVCGRRDYLTPAHALRRRAGTVAHDALRWMPLGVDDG